MESLIFDLQLFAPDGEGGEGGGGTPPGGEGGGSSSSVSWSANTSITSGGTYSNQTYTSTNADENAVLISTTETVTLNDVTVTKSGGTSASDNYSFYGINSAVMCMGGGTTSIIGGTVTTSAAGANGIFSYGANNGTTNATGDGTTVYVKDVTISTTAQGSGGIMTTYGGTTVAENLTITTSGGSSAPIRTDRGGGTVEVTGGSYTSNGLGSPAIYSTADITVNDAELISNQSEGVCIEGAGTIALSNCTLTANNSALNGNATFYDTIMIYQSQSGDASDGTSAFSMTGGTLNSQNGHVFHVTNTTAEINLDGVTINNSDSNNILLSVCDDGWSGADNVVTFNASNQTLEGDMLVGSDSTLTLNLENSTFTGNVSGNITNASGGSVSTSIGTVNVTLDDDSKWYLTGDTYVTNFDGDAAQIISNGFTFYVNNVALDGTTESETSTDAVCKIGDVTYTSLQDAANAVNGDDTITLLKDITATETIDFGVTMAQTAGEVTLDLAGYTISGSVANDGLINIGASRTLTVTGDGTISNSAGMTIHVKGGLNVESGTISSSEQAVVNYGTTKISGGTFSGEIVNDGGTLEITGGTFDTDISNYVADGYSATQNAEGDYIVSAISGDTALNITNSEDNTLITGTAYADTISNTGNNVTIDALAGDDSITATESENIYINAGEGNNYVFNGYTYFDENNELIDKESEASTTSSTILTGSGNDTIVNQGIYNASVDAGDGDNVINIYHSYTSTLTTGSGDDLIDVARGGSLSVYTGEGNDSIIGHLATLQTTDYDNWAFGGGAVVDASDGDDYISLHYSDNSTIYGGAGNDTIINNGANTTINGGDGDDYIELTNNLREETGDYEPQVIVASAGNDTITGVTSNTTIQGTFTASTVDGSNVILTSGDGNLTILDGAGQTLNINGTESVISGDNETIGAAVAEFILKKTEKGYPALADTGLFEPDTVGSAAPEGYLTENWTIESADNLKLSGVHYAPENPKGQWIVLVTGYGQVGATMNLPATVLLTMDYDVLVIDPRASGSSEGDWLTMGVAECVDVALWTQKIAETNSNAQITLYGISMGAATVMMAAALSQTTNVTSIVEDCGYANIYSIFENLVPHFAESFGWTGSTEELFEKVADATETLTGYNVADAVPLDSIANVTVPSMFIHGTADTLVPVEDAQTLYDASGATTKEIWTVEGAGHAKSITQDPLTYLTKASELIEKANKEIGASISSTVESQLLRGTIYDDTINNTGDNVTIDSGAGNDNISISADNVSVNTGEGDNTVFALESEQLKITTGDGNNSIYSTYVTYDEEKQAYVNYDSNTSSTIITGDGNDTIANEGMYQSSVDAGDGDNVIGLYHSYENTVTTGAGNDSIIVGRGSTLNLMTGDGNDTIQGTLGGVESGDWSFGGSSTVDAGAGDDYIAPHYSDKSSIFGGEGNDTIINNGANTTINGGAGDDYIELTNNRTTVSGDYEAAVIVASAGNDTLKNYSDVVTISGSFDSLAQDGNNVILTSGENTLTLTDYTEGFINIVDSEGNFAQSMLAGTFEVTENSPVTVNDIIYSGNGTVSIENGNVSLNGDISVEGDIEEFMLAGIGNYTVNGKDFELITDVENAITISAQENGYSVSHIETAEEAELYGDPASAVGKTFTENLTVKNDDDYKLTVRHMGISVVSGISNNAQVQASAEFDGAIYEYGTGFNIVTDETGVIILGENAFTISGDNNVSLKADFNNDGTAALAEVEDLNGEIDGNFNSIAKINTNSVSISGGADNSRVENSSDNILIYDVASGSSVTLENKVYANVKNSMTVNDVNYVVTSDSDGVSINGYKNVGGLSAKASLSIGTAGNYTVNNTALAVSKGDVVIGVNDNYAYIYDENNPPLDKNMSTAEILNNLGVSANDAKIVSETVDAEQKVELNNGGDIAIVEATEQPVTVSGGNGDDIFVTKGENVTVDMKKGGADKISALAGTVKLENYNPDLDAGIKMNTDDMISGLTFGDGAISLSNATVEVGGNVVNLYDVTGNKQKVGFATNGSKVVDLHKSKDNALILGGDYLTNNAVSGATLLGGFGNDTVYGGENSYISPDSGNDIVELSSLGGATVEFFEGKDTINNFNFVGGDVTADKIETGKYAIENVQTSNGAVILQTKNGTVQITDAANQNFEVQNDYTNGAVVMQVGDDTLNYDGVASLFWAGGKNATVSVGEQDADNVNVDLSHKDFNDTSKASFYGDIKEVDASNFEGTAQITGNDKNNVLTASKGGSTLNGGSGNNSLIGGDGADDFIAESGNTTISNFTFGTEENSDMLNAGSAAVAKIKARGNDLVLTSDNGGTTRIENGVGQIMQFQSEHTNSAPILAQFDNTAVSVNDDANFYWAAGKNATVTFENYTGETLGADLTNANFNDAENLSFYGDIKEIDASDFNGAAQLKGNNKNNVITASKGGSTLNGGGGNNSMVGGAGEDLFIAESGNTTISNFEFGIEENSDKLNSGAQAIRDVNVSGDNVILKTDDGLIRIADANNQVVQLQNEYTNNKTIYAQFGNNELDITEDANFYWAGGTNATVSVADYGGENVNIDLSNADFNDDSKLSFYGNIKAVDATGYTGDATLNGGANNNVLTGGNGNTELWGGDGNYADTLIGGVGDDTFIYGKNNGNDVVRDADENDVVKFDSITLDDLTATGNNLFVGNDVKFELKDGGTLTVKDAKTSGVTFDVAGTKYAVNQNGEWEFK